MKKELPGTSTTYELLNRSKILASELKEMLEHSRELLDESAKLIARLKPGSLMKSLSRSRLDAPLHGRRGVSLITHTPVVCDQSSVRSWSTNRSVTHPCSSAHY